MPIRTTPPGQIDETIEHVREGTREQYESEWVFIPPSVSRQFDHNLGEIPWVVSILRSDDATGSVPSVASVETTADPHNTPGDADVQLDYLDVDSTTGTGTISLTVTNQLDDSAYFKVRAM